MTFSDSLAPDLAACHVTIIGLGLMGGSLAHALRGRVARLTAVERHAATRQRALNQSIVDAVTDDLASGIALADLIILATPVRTILELLPQIGRLRPDGCTLIDLGSTKSEICAAMEALPSTFHAIGGHPMCGKETAGLEAASADLYQNQTFILCRNGRTTPHAERHAHALITTLGANPLPLEPALHDQMVAAISHLPYLVASVLMAVVADQAAADERLWQVSASGFRDAARLAGSDPTMLRDILLTNRAAVLAQLGRYQTQLAAVTHLLQTATESELAQWLQQRQADHAAYRQKKQPTEPNSGDDQHPKHKA